MSDLIDRQAAIDEIERWLGYIDDDMVRRMQIGMKRLPSAQPEIIRCKDCKYMIDTGDDLMCDNAKGWVVATTSDFGCVLAERREVTE